MADPALGGVATTESAARLQALVPQLRVAHIPDAGHTIRRDQFGRYLESVRGFLAEQPVA
jgi:N-formylmaleamate deformylase